VFVLLIALPAAVLALLGVGSIRAGDLERRQRLRDQETQVARLADVALAAALDREAAAGASGARASREHSADQGHRQFEPVTAFETDHTGVIVFPGERVYVGSPGAPPANRMGPDLPMAAATLVEAAQAATAQGRAIDAVERYNRLLAYPQLRSWAELQTRLLDEDHSSQALATWILAQRFASSDARSPAGIPLAIVAASLNEGFDLPDRRRFLPFLRETLASVRKGQWQLDLEERRAYDAELCRWLNALDGTESQDGDPRLDMLADLATVIATAFKDASGLPPRVLMTGSDAKRTLLVWNRPAERSDSWSGVAVSSESATTLFSESLGPLVAEQPFRAVLRDRRSVLWGAAIAEDDPYVVSLESIPGWSLAFSDASPPAALSARILAYAQVVLPILVLAFGLVMTVWMVRREMALAAMQASFVAAVTHEFKSPITSIRLSLERLTGGRVLGGERPDRYFEAIGAETDRLEALVDRLLSAHMQQNGCQIYAFQPASLATLVHAVVDRMRPQAEARHIALQVEDVPNIPPLALDAKSVSDAVRNLIDNALKYSPSRSTVQVALRAGEDKVEVLVSDEGVGVDPGEVQRIFQPFYRSRRGDEMNVQGTGLGLALVKATAEAHGGSVRVASDGRRGSCFTLAFPTAAATQALNGRR
jgi:signal transduction histidine kinase